LWPRRVTIATEIIAGTVLFIMRWGRSVFTSMLPILKRIAASFTIR